MSETAMKPLAVELLTQARAAEEALTGSFDPATLEAIGTLEHWSAKDIVVHLNAWKRIQAERLVAAERGEEPLAASNNELVDQLNRGIYETWQQRPWAEVHADTTAAYNALHDAVSGLPEEALTDPKHYAWQVGARERPLWDEILGNGAFHPLGHLTQLAREHGTKTDEARLQEAALQASATLVAALDSMTVPNGARANAIYNLACVHVTGAHPEEALPLLPEAFRLNPQLAEWATQDTDLDSLRDLPEFQRLLVTSEPA